MIAVGVVAGATPAAAAPPDAPTNVVATATGSGTVSLAFTPSPNDPAGSTYTATSAPGGLTCTSTSSPCVVTGLTNGTAYAFTVTSHNAATGTSAPSNPSSSVTPVSPQTITFNPIPGMSLTAAAPSVSATASSGLTVSFNSSPAGVCTVGPSIAPGLAPLTLVSDGTCTLTAFQSGDVGFSPAPTVTQSFAVGQTPGAPTGASAVAGAAQAAVSFTAPGNTGGVPIAYYTVSATPGPVTATCPGSPCLVSNLTNGVSYSFKVTATNTAAQTSVASSASNSVTPGLAPTITFTNPGAQTVGKTATLAATSTAASPAIIFTSATPSVCTVSGTNGTTLTPIAVGSCVIDANQAADATHLAALQAFQTFNVTAGTTLAVTASASTSVFGQPVTFTATIGSPVPTGTLQWSVDGTNVGSPVTLTTSTTYTFTPPTALSVGTHTVKATYSGDSTHASVNAQATETVSKASTTTTVGINGGTLTATVAPVAPGAGVPTGT
ncbi:MAG TPA: Ig-like domain repeat protein, partial [Mycobacteriales bacterium]|nr:Ig-like domain repeat protein [Mycobacteriales bacterium]